jgi:hypothetical protein
MLNFLNCTGRQTWPMVHYCCRPHRDVERRRQSRGTVYDFARLPRSKKVILLQLVQCVAFSLLMRALMIIISPESAHIPRPHAQLSTYSYLGS